MQKEANLSQSSNLPSTGEFNDSEPDKISENVKKELDKLCGVTDAERARRMKLLVPSVGDSDRPIRKQNQALLPKHLRLVVYSLLEWKTQVYKIAVVSREERLVLGSGLARNSDKPLSFRIKKKLFYKKRPTEWRRWLSKSLQLVQNIQFYWEPDNESGQKNARKIGEILGYLPRDALITFICNLEFAKDQKDSELLLYFDFKNVVQAAREINEGFKFASLTILNPKIKKLSFLELAMMQNCTKHLQLQNIEIDGFDHMLTQTEPLKNYELTFRKCNWGSLRNFCWKSSTVCEAKRTIRNERSKCILADIRDLNNIQLEITIVNQQMTNEA